MNIAYFGSPEIAAVLLQNVIDSDTSPHKISFVLTQPDKPVGKRLELKPTPVKETAQKNNIPVFDYDPKQGSDKVKDLIRNYNVDLCFVYAYGELVPQELMNVPKYGFYNLHLSLLPLYRGPSPTAYPIMLGDEKTGISIIKLNEVLDSGPILKQTTTKIQPNETRADLELRLTSMSTELIQSALQMMEGGNYELTPQEETKATHTKLLKKDHGFIPLKTLRKVLQNDSLEQFELPHLVNEYIDKYDGVDNLALQNNSGKTIYDYYRALSPWPGIWTMVQTNKGQKRLKLNSLSFDGSELMIDKVQLEGRNIVNFKEFNTAYNIFS